MPGPTRRQHDVASLHRDALAIDNGVSTAYFNTYSKRCPCMAVSPRNLPGHDDLDVGNDGVVCGTLQPRIA
jgi:hypothetical protein